MNQGHGAGAEVGLTLDDYALLARARLEAGVWDFIAGGAGEERTVAANLEAFERLRLRPRVLTGAAEPDTGVTVLGRRWAVPVGIAPMAYHTLVDPAGEVATAGGAGLAGAPLIVSMFAGRALEEIAAAASAPLWLQVYCFKDRLATRRLVERALGAGFEAVVLTVDAPHLGRRLRDLRNRFRLPAGLRPANLVGSDFSVPASHALGQFDASLDWSVVSWLRSITPLPLLLKGIMTASDALRAAEAGVAGIVVSNHGGRQLDGVAGTLDVLPEIAGAVAGRCAVLLDGGIRRGTDVLASLALGADAVLVGRPVLHGLAVGGGAGVARVLSIVIEELADAMRLAGVRSAADVAPELVAAQAGPKPRAAVEPRGWPQTGTLASRPAFRAARPGHGPSAAGRDRPDLLREDLHASVADPVLDTMNFLNEVTLRYPDTISFAPGRPYEGFFDTGHVFAYIRRYLDYLAESGKTPEQIREAVFQYGPTAGRIRELIADSLRRDENIDVAPESIVVTVGCQEAMVLALRALISGPQDVLIVSSPCYVGISGAASLLDVTLIAVDEREDGLCCADLEAAIDAEVTRGRRPRACYVVPDHSNPSGLTMPLATRRALLEVAASRDILVLEDSPYRLVSPGQQLPSLKSLDSERRVLLLGSFSKTAFPGARVGFAVADQTVADASGRTRLLADELARIKSMVTVNTSALSQAAIAGLLLASGGGMSASNAAAAAYYGNAMASTLRQLDLCLPVDKRKVLGVRWNRPAGGFFLTVRVPFRADNAALERSAEKFGVIWTPMSYFYPQGGGDFSLRLSISHLTQADIEEGIGRLARFIEAEAELSAEPGVSPR
jgi:(S)-3,5-dihydroxyphenylglycine transaminase